MQENVQKSTLLESVRLPVYFILVLWIIHLLERLLLLDVGYLGILPREMSGLRGVLFAPLLHADWTHLFSNTVPFLVLSTIMIYFYPRVAVRAFVMIYLVSGIAIWSLARPWVYHIGLSYVVYGLVSFVFWNGVFRRSIRAIILSLIVTILYSGMFAGMAPTEEVIMRNISWESHLIGAIVGMFASYYYKEEVEEDEHGTRAFATEEKQHYFERDLFDKTREERLQEQLRLEEEQKRIPPSSPFGDWFSSHT